MVKKGLTTQTWQSKKVRELLVPFTTSEPNFNFEWYNLKHFIIKKLELNQMEFVFGEGWWNWDEPLTEADWGCAALGLAAGIASGMNPLVGGLTTLGCMLTT